MLEGQVDLEDLVVDDFKQKIFLIYFHLFLVEVFQDKTRDKLVENNEEKILSMTCTLISKRVFMGEKKP
jgi:hypothetical protein